VADVVGEAGLSNDAFYRYFPSKDALVAAILEDGSQRLQSYVAHQMAKESTPQARVHRWVEGVLSQAMDEEVATTTLAVMWNGGTLSGPSMAVSLLAPLLHEPFADLGSARPDLDASLAAYATLGILVDHLWQQVRPTPVDVDDVASFCLGAVRRSK
jgi:AcrR family transcriptional regulator